MEKVTGILEGVVSSKSSSTPKKFKGDQPTNRPTDKAGYKVSLHATEKRCALLNDKFDIAMMKEENTP